MALPEELRNKPNPYDFRNPVPGDRQLASREAEAAEIKASLESTALGSPVNVALVGERAAGKTSLLNRATTIAEASNLLAVRVDLDEDLVKTPFAFFKAVFEACVQTLVRIGHFSGDDDRLVAWERALYARVPIEKPALLKFEWLVSPATPSDDVPVALIREDMETLAGFARDAGRQGICLLIDEGDLLAIKGSILQRLRNLFQSHIGWSLVIAGTKDMFAEISDVFSPIPRQFVRIDVGPFPDFDQVYRCVRQPLAPYLAALKKAELLPNFLVVFDIAEITGSRPYEINLVCYHLWERLRAGSQSTFAPSVEVLDQVMTELRQFGRTYANESEIELVRSLTEDDFETAVDLIAYTDLTPQEIALAKLWPSDFSPQLLETTLTEVQGSVNYLSQLGLLAISNGRVVSALSSGAHVYFRYAAEVHARQHIAHPRLRSQQPYPERIVSLVMAELQSAVGSPPISFIRPRTKEMIDPSVGRWIDHAAKGIREPNWSEFEASRILQSLDLPEFRETNGKVLTLVGFVTAIELLRVEHAMVLLLEEDQAQHVESQVRSWFADREQLLDKYGFRITELTFAVGTPAGTRDLAAYDYLSSYGHSNDAIAALMEGDFADGLIRLSMLQDLIDRHGDVLGGLPEGLNAPYADLLNRIGFFAMNVGETALAKSSFSRSQELRYGLPFITKHNEAYLAALDGDFDRAAEAEAEALRFLTDASQREGWLTFFIPPTDGRSFSDDYGNVLGVAEESASYMMHLQHRVYLQLAGAGSQIVFSDDCPENSASACRLRAWVASAMESDPGLALEWIERGIGALPERELEDDPDRSDDEDERGPSEDPKTWQGRLTDVLWEDHAYFEQFLGGAGGAPDGSAAPSIEEIV